MKFILITLLFFVLSYYISCKATWCGSTYAPITIETTENQKTYSTKGKILLPKSFEFQYKRVEKTFIQKQRQGLVISLDGPVNKKHLFNIYRYDEDSENDIYIPYSFITKVSSPDMKYIINLTFSKSFDGKLTNEENGSIIVKFIFEEYGPNIKLCKCQFDYIFETLKNNIFWRKFSLIIIRNKIMHYLSQYYIKKKTPIIPNPSENDVKKSLKIMNKVQIQCDEWEKKVEISRIEFVENEKNFKLNTKRFNCDYQKNSLLKSKNQLNQIRTSTDIDYSKPEFMKTFEENGSNICSNIDTSFTNIIKDIKFIQSQKYLKDLDKIDESFIAFNQYQQSITGKETSVELSNIEEIENKCATHKKFFKNFIF